MSGGLLFLAGLAVFVVFVVLEGRRQRRRYGPSSRRGQAMRRGLLELHQLLEPERKVEVLRAEVEDDRRTTVDAPPNPGPELK